MYKDLELGLCQGLGLITAEIIFPLEGGDHPSPNPNIRSKTSLPMEPFVKTEERNPEMGRSHGLLVSYRVKVPSLFPLLFLPGFLVWWLQRSIFILMRLSFSP